jgi:hypothetical protein
MGLILFLLLGTLPLQELVVVVEVTETMLKQTMVQMGGVVEVQQKLVHPERVVRVVTEETGSRVRETKVGVVVALVRQDRTDKPMSWVVTEVREHRII